MIQKKYYSLIFITVFICQILTSVVVFDAVVAEPVIEEIRIPRLEGGNQTTYVRFSNSTGRYEISDGQTDLIERFASGGSGASILPRASFGIQENDSHIFIIDPTNQTDGYWIDKNDNYLELNASRGQLSRQFYNVSSGEYTYNSALMVNKTGVIDGTDWVLYNEYPYNFVFRLTNGSTYFFSTPEETTSFYNSIDNSTIWCVGYESFDGLMAFYLNFADTDWGHAQYIYYPRLLNGQLAPYDTPLYAIYPHLYAKYNDVWYDKLLNDRSLYTEPYQNPKNTLEFFNTSDTFGLKFSTPDIDILASNWNFEYGFKYNFTDGLYHMINEIECTNRDFDDVGFAYEITSSPQSDGTPYQPDRFLFANDTHKITMNVSELWNAGTILDDYYSFVEIISQNNESFRFTFDDMEQAGFTQKYLNLHNQLMPDGSTRKVLRVGMYGYGSYTNGILIEIDPDVGPVETTDNYDLHKHDAGYRTGDTYQDVGPAFGVWTIGESFWAFDTGLEIEILSTSSVSFQLWLDDSNAEAGEGMDMRVYNVKGNADTSTSTEANTGYSDTAYTLEAAEVFEGDYSGSEEEYKTMDAAKMETLTDYWQINRDSDDEYISFRSYPDDEMDLDEFDYYRFVDSSHATKGEPILTFTYTSNTVPNAPTLNDDSGNTYAGKSHTIITDHTDDDGDTDIDWMHIYFDYLSDDIEIKAPQGTASGSVTIVSGGTKLVDTPTYSHTTAPTNGYRVTWTIIFDWDWTPDDENYVVKAKTIDDSALDSGLATLDSNNQFENDLIVYDWDFTLSDSAYSEDGNTALTDDEWFRGGVDIVASGTITYEGTTNVYPDTDEGIDVAFYADGSKRTEDTTLGASGAFSCPAYTTDSTANLDSTYVLDCQLEDIPTGGSESTTGAKSAINVKRDNQLPDTYTIHMTAGVYYDHITSDSTPLLTVSSATDNSGVGLHATPYDILWRRDAGSWSYSGYQSGNTWSPTIDASSNDVDFAVRVKDIVGNVGDYVYDSNNYVDFTDPVLGTNAFTNEDYDAGTTCWFDQGDTATANYNILFTETNVYSIIVTATGGFAPSDAGVDQGSPFTSTISITGKDDIGAQTISITITDKAGNTDTSYAGDNAIALDDTVPTISVTGESESSPYLYAEYGTPTQGAYSDNMGAGEIDYVVSGSSGDTGSGWGSIVDDWAFGNNPVVSGTTSWSFTYEINQDDDGWGSFTQTYTMTDNVGNTATATYYFFLDNTAPTMDSIVVTGDGTVGGYEDWDMDGSGFSINPSATSDASGVNTVYFEVGDSSPDLYSSNDDPYTYPVDVGSDGTYTFYAMPVDNLGNEGIVRSDNGYVDETVPIFGTTVFTNEDYDAGTTCWFDQGDISIANFDIPFTETNIYTIVVTATGGLAPSDASAGQGSPFTSTISISGQSDMTAQTISITITDKSGRTNATYSGDNAIALDNTAPSFSSFAEDGDGDDDEDGYAPNTGYYDDNSYQGDFSGASDGSGSGVGLYYIKYNGGSYGSSDADGLNVGCTIAAGDNDIYYKIVDNVGNEATGDTTDNVFFGETDPSNFDLDITGALGYPTDTNWIVDPTDINSGTIYCNVIQDYFSFTVDADGAADWGSGGAWKVFFDGGSSWATPKTDTSSPYTSNDYDPSVGENNDLDIDIVNNCGEVQTIIITTTTDQQNPVITQSGEVESNDCLYSAYGTSAQGYYGSTMASGVSYTINGTASDAISELYSITDNTTFGDNPSNTGSLTSWSFVYIIDASDNGDINVVYTAYDKCGNSATDTYDFIEDNTDPSITISLTADGASIDEAPNTGYYDDNSVDITTSNPSDGQSGLPTNCYSYMLTGGSWDAFTSTSTKGFTSVADGTYNLSVLIKDNVNNTLIDTIQVIVDTDRPTSHTLTFIDGDGYFSGDYAYAFYDAYGDYRIWWNSDIGGNLGITINDDGTIGNSGFWKVIWDETEVYWTAETNTSALPQTETRSYTGKTGDGDIVIYLMNNAGNVQFNLIGLLVDDDLDDPTYNFDYEQEGTNLVNNYYKSDTVSTNATGEDATLTGSLIQKLYDTDEDYHRFGTSIDPLYSFGVGYRYRLNGGSWSSWYGGDNKAVPNEYDRYDFDNHLWSSLTNQYNNTLEVEVYDIIGNGNSNTTWVILDTSAPSLTGLSLNETYAPNWYDQLVSSTAQASITYIENYPYHINASCSLTHTDDLTSSGSPSLINFTISERADGDYAIVITIYDKAGNSDTTFSSFSASPIRLDDAMSSQIQEDWFYFYYFRSDGIGIDWWHLNTTYVLDEDYKTYTEIRFVGAEFGMILMNKTSTIRIITKDYFGNVVNNQSYTLPANGYKYITLDIYTFKVCNLWSDIMDMTIESITAGSMYTEKIMPYEIFAWDMYASTYNITVKLEDDSAYAEDSNGNTLNDYQIDLSSSDIAIFIDKYDYITAVIGTPIIVDGRISIAITTTLGGAQIYINDDSKVGIEVNWENEGVFSWYSGFVGENNITIQIRKDYNGDSDYTDDGESWSDSISYHLYDDDLQIVGYTFNSFTDEGAVFTFVSNYRGTSTTYFRAKSQDGLGFSQWLSEDTYNGTYDFTFVNCDMDTTYNFTVEIRAYVTDESPDYQYKYFRLQYTPYTEDTTVSNPQGINIIPEVEEPEPFVQIQYPSAPAFYFGMLVILLMVVGGAVIIIIVMVYFTMVYFENKKPDEKVVDFATRHLTEGSEKVTEDITKKLMRR